MPEENKNLEIPKKPSKSWLFRIGLVLIILAIGSTWRLLSLFPPYPHISFLILVVFTFFGLPGVVLILINFFLKTRRKEKISLFEKVIIIICFLFFILLLSSVGLIVWQVTIALRY